MCLSIVFFFLWTIDIDSTTHCNPLWWPLHLRREEKNQNQLETTHQSPYNFFKLNQFWTLENAGTAKEQHCHLLASPSHSSERKRFFAPTAALRWGNKPCQMLSYCVCWLKDSHWFLCCEAEGDDGHMAAITNTGLARHVNHNSQT